MPTDAIHSSWLVFGILSLTMKDPKVEEAEFQTAVFGAGCFWGVQ